jgi:hypothetical protein
LDYVCIATANNHPPLGRCGILRCLGEIRNHKELDSGIRKVATDTLLAILENGMPSQRLFPQVVCRNVPFL